MKLAYRAWSIFLLLPWFAACQSAARAAEPDWPAIKARYQQQPLRWGGDAEGGAPFQLRAPHDPRQVIGFEVELVEAIAEVFSRHTGVPITPEFVQYEWVSLPLGLEKNDYDLVLSGYEITLENQRAVLFSRPYYLYTQQLVVRADEKEITELRDCRTKPVATLQDSAAHRILLTVCQHESQISAFDGQVEPYLDLELGRVDAVLLDTPITTYYASSNPKLKQTGPPIGQGEYGVAMRLGDTNLKAAVDAALAELFANGQAQRIFRKWRLWNKDQAMLAAEPYKAQELKGLGFDADGQVDPQQDVVPVDVVDVNIMASAAKQWTLDQYAPVLGMGALMTVFLTICSMALAMTIGLLVCLARLYGIGPLRWLALGYVEFFRGIPLLLLLFFLYFGLSHYGVKMSGELTAIIGFGMNYAAYEAEIYRSSIQSVPIGQWEAGKALGMAPALTFRRIIFPQAFRTALGPMTNDFVAMFKDTSLVSVIAVRELTKEYLILSRSSLKFVELGLLTAALYLLMSVPLGYLSRYLERKWGPGR